MTDLLKHAWDMAAAAEHHIETLSVEAVHDLLDDPDVTIVDIRDVRELWLEGTIPGARHAPRGMLEWWADPETEYYRDWFDPAGRYVLFCNEAGRSAVAALALREMGFCDVAHMAGGFTAWEAAGYEVEDVPQKQYK